MKIIKNRTRFGQISMVSMNIKNLMSYSPLTIFYKNTKRNYQTIHDYFSQHGAVTDKRFLSRAITVYMEEAINAMINERAEVPITDNGTKLLIAVDPLAVAKKDYKYDYNTDGKVFECQFIMPDIISKKIGYIYRIKLHKTYRDKLEQKIKEGFFYRECRQQFMKVVVNRMCEMIYLKKYKDPKYGYAIKF